MLQFSGANLGWRQLLATLLALLALAGCAGQAPRFAPQVAGLPAKFELAETPFFPDESHYCGPAALATSLSAAGLNTEPESLIGEVFLPGRAGSLQIEMLAGARRHGAVATRVPGTLEAVFSEIAAGHPVVILQNLGLSWAPSWHYAVAVGYDLEAGLILLRSGPMKRQELSIRTFQHTWDRAERWAFIALPPGQLAATANEAETVRALLAFERNASAEDSAKAYRAGLARWPNNPTLAMGLGNALHASGDGKGAEAAYRRVVETHGLAAAYNNLARVLLERGDAAEARRLAGLGLELAGPLRQTLVETLKAIDEMGNVNGVR